MGMSNRGSRTSLERIELTEKESRLRQAINDLRFKRQHLISEIKGKRHRAGEMKKKRDVLNDEVRKLVAQGKEHIRKRNEFQASIRKLKEKRTGITQEIRPKAERIRSEKEIRRQLNRKARTSAENLTAEFNAALKTLFEMELALRDEVIMVEMIMDIQHRFRARMDADSFSKDIKETWKDIKTIEKEATHVSTEIMTLAAKGESEHQAAMEMFDRKDELSNESQETHLGYVDLVKEIRSMSGKIDELSKEIDERFKELKPLQKKLQRTRLTRREEQRLEQLKVAKKKMETSGKIDLNDLRVLLESKALDLGGGREGEIPKKRKKK